MAVDPRTPVIIGVGQLNQRNDDRDAALEPVALLAEAARAAAADSGGRGVLDAIESIRVVSLLSWRYRDPGALVAELLGVDVRHTALTTAGGNSPQSLVNRTCLDIAAGALDVALLGGAEVWRTRMSFRAEDGRPPWTTQPDDVPATEVYGDELNMWHPAEQARGLMMPVQVYPMFESALRAQAGRSIDEHLVHISELWSRFSAVAARNPNAWIQRALTAEEIRTTGPDNRMIGFPYPKLMNSNNNVEQAAALILCSAAAADRLGVARDRRVFPVSGTDAHDAYFVTARHDMHSSPAMRATGRRAAELAGTTVDEIAHVDLYSCFPSAVQVAAKELGLAVDDPDRPLTVTGGMSFAGGPWNNYVTHSVATMVDVLRGDPGSYGLCSANGGYITKHAMGVYSTEPPPAGFRWEDCQTETEKTPLREIVAEHEGEVTVESCTVMHDREGEPENGFATVLTPNGGRAIGVTRDADALKLLITEECIGRTAWLAADGDLRL